MNFPPDLQDNQDSVMPEALAILQPLVAWLIRSGVGYGELVAALKPVFLAQAREELARHGHKATDSALSLLSGLHRKDVRAFREAAEASLAQARADGTAWGKPSAANQVVTRWLSRAELPDALPLAGSETSFDVLARSVSKDFHPRAVLQEMVRLGVAREEGGMVHLQRSAFVPDPGLREARQLMAGNVADHLLAGVHNLGGDGARKFLEQSVFADGLSPESAQKLNLLANQLWAQVLRQVVEAATPLCEQDAGHPAPQRFRLGLFSYAEAEQNAVQGPMPTAALVWPELPAHESNVSDPSSPDTQK